ncbi:DUF4097 family beta strand repeat-containing protein [Portibacter marinus]|uniref:hypothetical protein n=1 Tax=Portibacter marinus TaxID=2898660 RepID=UPI001F436C36|nr:hypothetical protein [Portibacter marinus]
MKQIIILVIVAMYSSINAQVEEIVVTFSKPSESKTIEIQLFSGDISIVGTDRSDVLIKYEVEKREDDHEHGRNKSNDKNQGLKKIGGGNFEFEIGEYNNEVSIKSQNWMNLIRLEIEVPKKITVDISKQMGENVVVENIIGDVNVENNIGSVTILGVQGAVNASSSTGEIIVEFAAIDPNQTMTFNTITGNIDLTVPTTHKANLKMRTEWGDIYTDMDIETQQKKEPQTKTVHKNGGMKLVSNNWTYGSMNGGGPEMTIKTQMGSIYLRAK